VAAAAVVEDPTRHWVGQGGDLLLPSRWADSELKKITIDHDSDPKGGRCLGIRCLMWDRCQVPSEMIHETLEDEAMLLDADGHHCLRHHYCLELLISLVGCHY
jgi:hypothetical protein